MSAVKYEFSAVKIINAVLLAGYLKAASIQTVVSNFCYEGQQEIHPVQKNY